MNNDIYITGAGVVSAIGMNKAETLDALLHQRTGVESVRYLPTSHTEFLVGEVKRSNDELREVLNIPPSEAYIRSSLLGIPAVTEALRQARLDSRPPRTAFLSGITVGGMDQAERWYDDFLTNDTKNAYIELNDCGACTEQIADYIGGFSMVSTVVTACSSSANAIMMKSNIGAKTVVRRMV